MRFVSCVSDHEAAHEAAAALARQARQKINDVDVAFFFFSAAYRSEAAAMVERLWLELDPQCIVGCSAEGIIGGEKEIERAPAASLLAAEWPGVRAHPFHVPHGQWRQLLLDEPESLKQRLAIGEDTRAIIGFGDPYTTPVNQFLAALDERCPHAPLIGGMASSANGPGENILVRNDETLDDGLVGVSLSGNLVVDAVVSQGCRPIGTPMVITRGKGNVIEAIGGRPPMTALRDILQELGEEDRGLLEHGLFIGKAISEYRDTFGRGDFLVRNLTGADQQSGAVAVNGDIRVGQTVQFHVRDAATADEDLRLLLGKQQTRRPAGALLFSCNGRGTRMFEGACHDVSVSRELLPDTPVAGFFAAGEFGPVGGRNFIHGHTASFALFRSPE
jgi:small ligand-binding sensory domain FIST